MTIRKVLLKWFESALFGSWMFEKNFHQRSINDRHKIHFMP